MIIIFMSEHDKSFVEKLNYNINITNNILITNYQYNLIVINQNVYFTLGKHYYNIVIYLTANNN